MSYDNYCVDCNQPIADDYERCYTCNQVHRVEDIEIPIDGVETETEKGILVVVEGEEVWLPKSQVTVDKDSGRLWVRRWLAEEKDLA